ncbi:hypothetical protein [Streptomyces asiaticus]
MIATALDRGLHTAETGGERDAPRRVAGGVGNVRVRVREFEAQNRAEPFI